MAQHGPWERPPLFSVGQLRWSYPNPDANPNDTDADSNRNTNANANPNADSMFGRRV